MRLWRDEISLRINFTHTYTHTQKQCALLLEEEEKVLYVDVDPFFLSLLNLNTF